ncbi:MAG: hypothetical protein C5S46_07415 [Candidatus Methanomarinus sp.]|uniref:Uncharacterized protein n=1 Tax=Candidatus Methanomarinus sp. TaxID=3386244 RepID=A0AC61S9D4_9EURY|nr:hypothetical protein C5S42_05285 [ANME-2 cluster archaeon]TKY91130.1 MAG: hypothetical protein C5S46_07415 [ANME-2 cluster archaeon]
MTQWRPYENKDTYYFLVDSKPAEIVDITKPDTVFCTAFVSTANCFNGVKKPDLLWFKQYKECTTLEESKTVLKNVVDLVKNENFQDLYIWVLSSDFSTIEKNGKEFLYGAEKEVAELKIINDTVQYKGDVFKIDKAKMLIWLNFCLCNMATSLVDKTLAWKKKRGVFLLDRLGDSDKRIQKFMRMITSETSLNKLWNRCAEDHKIKPLQVGFEFPADKDENEKFIPASKLMQTSLVDWIVFAAYAVSNGLENRDKDFQRMLIEFIDFLEKNNYLKRIHFKGQIKWK